MGKIIKAYRVTAFNKVDTTRYIEGDLFISNKLIGMLVNGKIETLNRSQNLTSYVRVKDVEKMIDDKLKEKGLVKDE